MGVADTFLREMGSEQDRQTDVALKAEQVRSLRKQQAQAEADAKRKYAIENATMIREHVTSLDFQKNFDDNPQEVGKWQAALNAQEMAIGTPITTLTDQRDSMYSQWWFQQIQNLGKGMSPDEVVNAGYAMFGPTYMDRKFTKAALEQAVKTGSTASAFAPVKPETSPSASATSPIDALKPEPVLPDKLKEGMASAGITSVDQLAEFRPVESDLIEAKNKYVTEMSDWNMQKQAATAKVDEQAKKAVPTATATAPKEGAPQEAQAPPQTAMNARDMMKAAAQVYFRNPVVQEDIENWNKNMALAKSAFMPTEFIDSLRVEGIRNGRVDPKTTREQWQNSFERDKFEYQKDQDNVKTAISIGAQVQKQMEAIVEGGGVASEMTIDDTIGKTLRSKVAPYQKTLWEINQLYQFVLTGEQSTEQMPEDFGITNPISALDQQQFQFKYAQLDYNKQKQAADMAFKIADSNRKFDLSVAKMNQAQSNSNRSYGLALSRLSSRQGKTKDVISTWGRSADTRKDLTLIGLSAQAINDPNMEPHIAALMTDFITKRKDGKIPQAVLADESDPKYQEMTDEMGKKVRNINMIAQVSKGQRSIKQSEIPLSMTTQKAILASIALNDGLVDFSSIRNGVIKQNSGVSPKQRRDETEYLKGAVGIATSGGYGMSYTAQDVKNAVSQGFVQGDALVRANKIIAGMASVGAKTQTPVQKPSTPLVKTDNVKPMSAEQKKQFDKSRNPASQPATQKPKATTTQKPVLSRLRSRTTNWTVTKEQKK